MSNWTLNTNTPAQPNNWDAISYGTPGGTGTFVAVANSGTIRVMTSPNGTTWSNTGITGNLIASGNFNSVTYGTPGGTGTFVAVASPRSVMYSNDGLTWVGNTGAFALGGNWTSVTYGAPGGIGTFVAVSNGGVATNPRVAYSLNAGITWSGGAGIGITGTTSQYNGVTYGDIGGAGIFVAVSPNITTINQVITSVDGINWIGSIVPLATWKACTYGVPNGTGTFVAIAISISGSTQTMYSTNGTTWTSGNSTFPFQSWSSVTYGLQGVTGTFVAVSNAVGGTGQQSMSSTDGINWQLESTPVGVPWLGISSGTPNGNPVFAAVGANNSMVSCFLENTRILIKQYGEEIYIPIQNLRKGDLIKTLHHGYIPIHSMGYAILDNDYLNTNITQKLYCKKTEFDDLIITGGHSILVDVLNDDEIIKTNKYWDVPKMIDNKYLLLACIDKNAEVYEKNGLMNIYHIALECEDIHRSFGIWANGILVETCSIDYLGKTMQ